LKKIINNCLSKVGYRLISIPHDTAPLYTYNNFPALETILRQFASSQDSSSPYSRFDLLRSYLSDRRISFFINLLAIVEQHDVSLDDKTIADLGCGTGFLLRLIAETSDPEKLVGYDTSAEMNVLAREVCSSALILDTDASGMHELYNVIFCTEVLEHLVDPASALTSMLNQIKPMGTVILTVPNGRTDQESARKARDDGTAYWGHIHFWSPESWPLFIESVIQSTAVSQYQVAVGVLTSGENYAIISNSNKSHNRKHV